ncbi:MAG: hypothetical protein IJO10_00565 [Clostridia bacterium]|nr:hypothetical protein [Clostridia bacterium]
MDSGKAACKILQAEKVTSPVGRTFAPCGRKRGVRPHAAAAKPQRCAPPPQPEFPPQPLFHRKLPLRAACSVAAAAAIWYN